MHDESNQEPTHDDIINEVSAKLDDEADPLAAYDLCLQTWQLLSDRYSYDPPQAIATFGEILDRHRPLVPVVMSLLAASDSTVDRHEALSAAFSLDEERAGAAAMVFETLVQDEDQD